MANEVYLNTNNSKVQRRARYVFQSLSTLGDCCFTFIDNLPAHRPRNDTLIVYGEAITDNSNAVKQNLIFIPSYQQIEKRKHFVKVDVPNIADYLSWGERRVPFWYSYYALSRDRPLVKYQNSSGAITSTEDSVTFGFDIIMSAFFLLSCQEEYMSNKRDKWERFLAEYSQRGKPQIGIPVVNYYKEILAYAISQVSNELEMHDVTNETLTVSLSHDVDNVYSRGTYNIVRRFYRGIRRTCEGNFPEAKKEMLSLFNHVINKKSDWNFENYMKLENDHKFKSTFNFLGGKRIGRYAAHYKIENLGGVIKKLDGGGWEIGSHFSFYNIDDPDKLLNEKKRLEDLLGKQVKGGRSHYLKFKVPSTWRKLEKAGFQYDSSLGYPDALGFRAGIAYPFRPYDLENDKVLNIVEVPLVIMDRTLINQYGRNVERAWKEIKKILDTTKECGGFIGILWHQYMLNETEFPGMKKLYLTLLDYLRKINARVVTNWEAVEMFRNVYKG